MSRYIDADALVEFWSADFTEEEIHKLHIPLAVAIENIKDAPTVKDAQEAYRLGYKKGRNKGRKKGIQVGLRSADKKIVRCKDCKFYYKKQEECPFKWKDLLNDNDFCSYAERRNE